MCSVERAVRFPCLARTRYEPGLPSSAEGKSETAPPGDTCGADLAAGEEDRHAAAGGFVAEAGALDYRFTAGSHGVGTDVDPRRRRRSRGRDRKREHDPRTGLVILRRLGVTWEVFPAAAERHGGRRGASLYCLATEEP